MSYNLNKVSTRLLLGSLLSTTCLPDARHYAYAAADAAHKQVRFARAGHGSAAVRQTSTKTALQHGSGPKPAAMAGATHGTGHGTGARASTTAEEVQVAGILRSKAKMSVVSASMIRDQVTGASPLKALNRLPGVMFNSADALGQDVWSLQLYMRGFDQTQIGMSLDGIPLGEMIYRNYNGLPITQALASQNIAQVDVSPGAGNESVPSTNNLGGSISFVSRDPKDRLGAEVDQGFGSYSSFMTFVRFDSGKLNASGTKFFVSYARNDSEKWKGYGSQLNEQVNAKLVQPVGEDSRISVLYDYSHVKQVAYLDYSFAMLSAFGQNMDYLAGGPNAYKIAYLAAQGVYIAGQDKVADAKDATYYSGTTQITDQLGALTADFALNTHIRWKTVVYGHGEENVPTWGGNPYMASPDTGAPLSQMVKRPTQRRFGVNSYATGVFGKNTATLGTWYENDHYFTNQLAYNMPLLGQGEPSVFGPWGTPFATLWSETYNTNTFTAYLQDEYRILKNLTVHAGFRSLLSTTHVGNVQGLPSFTGTDAIAGGVGLTTAEAFLPHVSIDWKFLPGHELYFDFAKNAKAYSQTGYHLGNSPFAVSQAAFDASRGSLRPESALTYSLGYHYSSHLIDAGVSAYRVNFSNRIQQISAGSIIDPVTEVLNVGGVSMNGVDALATLRPIEGMALTNSLSYNHSTYDNNIMTMGKLYHTAGQQVIGYPRLLYKGTLSYRWRALQAYVETTYTSKRNFSYVGDVKIPSYWLTSFGTHYFLGDRIGLKNITFNFNIYNITGTHYISTMGTEGFSMSGDYQSLMLGAPRQFFGSVHVEY
ncbi:MAG: TonB-dependent receptor [Acetobacter sp.]|uniref:TonB-dependent receptor n=1 Tax=Acetobacter sp. TaxID=440 RepID=UPI0039E95988